jgi:hypothetical protein
MRACGGGLVGLALAAVLLGGCATEPATSPDRAGAPDDAASAATAARMVRVEVSGGLTGVNETTEVRRGDPPAGMSTAQADRVLALAGSPAVRALDGRRPPRLGTPCCDLRTFAVVVRHGDGTRTRVVVSEAAPVPPQLTRLVTLVSSSG